MQPRPRCWAEDFNWLATNNPFPERPEPVWNMSVGEATWIEVQADVAPLKHDNSPGPDAFRFQGRKTKSHRQFDEDFA